MEPCGTGDAPFWAQKRENIMKCPVGKARVDIFGNKVKCMCGYHPEAVYSFYA
jgi:hypothetical protein